jgi:hypothetical protein
MRRTVIALAATASAALTGAFLAAEPAAAGPRDTWLTVSVRPATGPVRSVSLTCRPAGGTHGRAADACAALIAAGGDPTDIPAADVMCTMEHAPLIARVTGRYQNRTVRYRQTFGNSCEMARQTGALFQIQR